MALSFAKWEDPRDQALVGHSGGGWGGGGLPILAFKIQWDTPGCGGSVVVTEPANGAERLWEEVQAVAPESSGV